MLITAQRAEQLRVAIIEDQILKDYHIEIADRGLTRGNIYRGVVANVQPSLGAAFIEIGEERHGFLPASDVLPSAYHQKWTEKGRPRIEQILTRGRSVLVQVTKDGSGQKGPALTTNVALAGRYLVLTPFDAVRGISRKAEDDKERKKIRERVKGLNLPDGHGAIVRTNGLEQNKTTLNRDLSALLRLWKRIHDEVKKGKGPRLLYSDQDLVVQALRDFLDPSIAEVLVDSDEVHEKAAAYMRAFMPRSKTALVRYRDRLPLFSRYRLETQIDRIYERMAPLAGGGYLVIDSTEALTAIDVNSGRATRTADHDETIFAVNLEAAREVARQLRLRDIGGLVVIDFIDMRYKKHQRKVEKVMRDAMKDDRARYAVGKISPNGLLEINRQRIKQALRLRTHRPCPTCQGSGTIAAPEFAALNLLRRIEARAVTGLFEGVTVALHPEIADALQNSHRIRLAELEQELDFGIEILSAPTFKRSEDRFEWQERETPLPAAAAPRIAPALTATDLTVPGDRRSPARPTAATGGGPAAETEESPAPRKRRRRRRKSPAKPAAREAAASTAPGKSAAGSPAADKKTAAEEPKKAKPSRSRRRRGPRRRAKSAAGKAAESAASQPAAEKKPQRKRSRRKPNQRTDADGGQPSGGKPAAGAPAAGSPVAGDSESAPRSRSPRRRSPRRPAAAEDSKPTEGRAKPAESSSKWDSGPAEKLRWQWWGDSSGAEGPGSAES